MGIQQQLKQQFARLEELITIGGDIHVFGNHGTAGRLVLVFAGNSHDTQPAVFQWAQQGAVAQHRDMYPFAFRYIKDGTPSRSFHCLTINTNLHRTLHVFLQTSQ